MENIDILEIGAITITLISVVVFVLVQLNEVRLEARILIYDEVNKRGKDQLLAIERQFAKKLVSVTVNDRTLTLDDLDQIFLDYLSDNNFLNHFSKMLDHEVREREDFKFCPSKALEIEKSIADWAKGDLATRIPKRFFSRALTRNWKYRVLLVTRRNYFDKRAMNFLIEVRRGMAAVAEAQPEKIDQANAATHSSFSLA